MYKLLSSLMSHINLNELDISKLRIGKSGKTVKIFYGKDILQIVTGKMYSPFGVRVNPSNYSNWTTCNIDCSLNQSDSELSIAYKTTLENLDKRIKELISESANLFDKASPELFNDIDSFYSPVLRENKTYPKLIKISLPRDSKGNFEFVIFDENKEKVQLNDNNITEVLCKGKIFKSILECTKIWYYNGRFGTTWNLKQMRFTQNDETKSTPISMDNKIYQTNMLLDD